MIKAKALLGWGFVALIIIFLVMYLRDIDYTAFEGIRINWAVLAIATLISLAFRYWGVLVWRTILLDLGATKLPKFSTLADVYAKAWMGRYIPGTVAWIASKVYLANKQGISKSRLTVSSLLEGGVQIVASLSVSLLLLAADPRLSSIGPEIRWALVALALVSLIALLPPVLNFVLRRGYSLIKRQPAFDELRTNFRATARSYGLYIIGNGIAGTSYYLMVSALYPPTDLSMAIYIAGSFILAGALGMATPFVPSGLGVRDGAQLVLLSFIMPKEIALAITVFSRLWTLFVDVLFYFVARGLKRPHE